MARKRKAHYLSRFYLASFTLEGDASGFLHVRSKKTLRTWRARASEVAHERDLFRTKGRQFHPDELEDAFAAVESEIAPVLRRVVASRRLPVGKDLDILLHIIALNAARPPAEIAAFQARYDEAARRTLVHHLTPELHQRVLGEWRVQGRDTEHVEDLEALKARVLAGRVRAVPDRDFLLVTGVLGRASVLVDLLGQRSWTLLVARGRADFITSDRPVSLLNNRNLPVGRPVQARFDDPRFDVIMPLSRKLALVGHLYDPLANASASARTVGFINHITDTGAADFVYCSTQESLVSPDGQFGSENGEAYRRDLGVAG